MVEKKEVKMVLMFPSWVTEKTALLLRQEIHKAAEA